MVERILAHARTLGFDVAKVSSRLTPTHFDAFERWLEHGMEGSMNHLRTNKARRSDLRSLLDDARSVIVVGVNYAGPALGEDIRHDPSRGIIATYAGGKDYHPWILARLEKLADYVSSLAPGTHCRAYVDTGPVLERGFAAQAGLGFIGKNTCLIHPRRGSYFILGVLITNLQLFIEENPTKISCGTCTRCLEACPTGALVEPYVLDARRCISYLTTTYKGTIPQHLRPLIGNRIFGCDECQVVCPWNKKHAQPTNFPAFQSSPERQAPELASLVHLTEEEFKARFNGTSILRTKRRGFLRNLAVALGNSRRADALEPLDVLLNDDEPLVRAHAAWGLGRIGKNGRLLLEKRKGKETDAKVLEEIEVALGG